jgi:hypothetical protein
MSLKSSDPCPGKGHTEEMTECGGTGSVQTEQSIIRQGMWEAEIGRSRFKASLSKNLVRFFLV